MSLQIIEILELVRRELSGESTLRSWSTPGKVRKFFDLNAIAKCQAISTPHIALNISG